MSMQPFHLFITASHNEFTNIRWLEGNEPVGQDFKSVMCWRCWVPHKISRHIDLMPGALGPTDGAFRQPRGCCNIHISLSISTREVKSEKEAALKWTKKKSMARIEQSTVCHQDILLTYLHANILNGKVHLQTTLNVYMEIFVMCLAIHCQCRYSGS